MTRLPPPLFALSPGTLGAADVGGFLTRLASAAAAGLTGVLLREPGLDDRPLLDLAREVRRRLDEHAGSRGFVAVHDRAHVALAAGADAVHGGFRSLSPADLRALVGSRASVGFSTHRGDGADVAQPCDFVFHGPVRPTASKRNVPNAPAVVGFDGLTRAVAELGRPVWAIGGIQPDDVARARDAGASGVAVLSGVLAAPDPANATRRYLAAVRAAFGALR